MKTHGPPWQGAGYVFLVLLALFVMFSPAFGQTLSISNPATPAPLYLPGAVIPLNITKAGLPAATGFQFDIALGAGTFAISPGPALPGGKILSCSPTPPFTCLAAGFNQTLIPEGVVAVVTVTLPAAVSSTSVPVVISSPLVTDKDGSGVPVTLGNPTVSLLIRGMCDVNGDGSVSFADFTAAANAVLGHTTSAATDLDKNGVTDVRDVQIVGTAGTPPAFLCGAK